MELVRWHRDIADMGTYGHFQPLGRAGQGKQRCAGQIGE